MLSHRDDEETDESLHRAISPYLFAADNLSDPHLVVSKESTPINGLPAIRKGVEPLDDGHYILSADEVARFKSEEPAANKVIFPLVGGREYINGQARWLLVPSLLTPQELRDLPLVRERIRRVREYRTNGGPLARSLADRPMEFHVFRQPKSRFLVIPEVSSIKREYIPIGWLSPPHLPSGKTRFVAASGSAEFPILTSRMHMSWVRYIGGRVKSDYSYSGNINYNTFPWPALTDADKTRLETLAQAVLDARAAHPGASLADLYDPDVMPANLRKAHRALDLAVDRLYRKAPFESDRERVEHLFMLYEKMTAGLLAKPDKPKRRKKADA
ncbi:type IIL restriction-modification enzyme MmeI [Brevundimonas sp. DS20]|uniref:type IIL restriction-modification enzyme MmeI n=1 Tax=Brevundimonas sp. DS20 TaxID=1532555 RepID=UPI0012E1AD74|nr:type IIL restriction-modification enzyme MmeI [Brevundimonas sp. DS20]